MAVYIMKNKPSTKAKSVRLPKNKALALEAPKPLKKQKYYITNRFYV